MRRYSEFLNLFKHIKKQEKLEGVPLPKIENSWFQVGGKEISERSRELEFALNELLLRNEIRDLEAVRFFLLTETPFSEFENESLYQRIRSLLPQDFNFLSYQALGAMY